MIGTGLSLHISNAPAHVPSFNLGDNTTFSF